MPRQGYDYEDLGGGINVGSAPAAILPKQMANLENFFPYGTILRRRGGHRAVSLGAAESGATVAPISLFTYRRSLDEDPMVLIGGKTNFARLEGDTIIDLYPGDVTLNSSDDLWSMFQYKNYAYAMRPLSGRMIRLNKDVSMRSGISAPLTAATIAQGASGALPAGTYKAVYTFYNTETGIESNPSPVSNALSLAASKKINYTGIAVSVNPFVNARRIYRTLENQTGVYFFVAQIDDNLTTTFTGDNVEVADLGRTVSFNNGTPPAQARFGVTWQERCFCTDGRDIFYSEPLMVEAFGDESIIPVFPDDGHNISGLHAFGDRLIIAKTNKIHYLVGASPTSFGLHTLTDRHGCLSHHSIQSAEGNLFWLGSGKSVMRSDGTNVQEIGNPEVKPYLDQITNPSSVIGVIDSNNNWYLLAIPDIDKVLVYNYRYNTWTVFTTDWGYPITCLSDYFDSSGSRSVYALRDAGDFILKFADPTYNYDDEGPSTNGIITALISTKEDSLDAPGYYKSLHQIWLLISNLPADPGGPGSDPTLSVGIYWGLQRIGEGELRSNLSLDVGSSQVWRAYRLSQPTKPNTLIQARINYSGVQPLDLYQIHFEAAIMKRKPRLM